MQNVNGPSLVMKFAEDFESIAHEIKVLKKINKKSKTVGFPLISTYGMFIGANLDPKDVSETKIPEEEENTRFFAYYVMPKYEKSLQDYLDANNDQIEASATLKIMGQVFKALEVLHSVGYNHNDIKPSNIMIDDEFNATLIDFGFTTKFMATKNVHLDVAETKSFRGNLLYSSYDQMQFKTTSRKDDLISACYLMLTLLNGNVFPMMRRSMTLEYNDN